MLELIEEGDFQGATGKLLVMLTELQKAVESLTYVNKLTKTEIDVYKQLWEDERARNKELVRAGKEAMVAFQEREKKMDELEEEKVELTCRLRTVSDVVSDKEQYCEDLLAKWKEGVDKTVEEAAG